MTEKDCYLTTASIEPWARDIERQFCPPHRPRPPLGPSTCALLLVDLQDYFLAAASPAFIPSAPAILPRLKQLAMAYTQGGWPLFFTRHLNRPEDAGQMARWWQRLLKPQDPLARLTAALAPEIEKATVLEKTQYDAFYNTPLEQLLRQRGVRQLIIGGVMTHLCCESTARSAFVRGFEVFFPIDGSATYRESFHRASLLNLAHGAAHLVLIEDLLAALARPEIRG